jgi:hypothetical protein
MGERVDPRTEVKYSTTVLVQPTLCVVIIQEGQRVNLSVWSRGVIPFAVRLTVRNRCSQTQRGCVVLLCGSAQGAKHGPKMGAAPLLSCNAPSCLFPSFSLLLLPCFQEKHQPGLTIWSLAAKEQTHWGTCGCAVPTLHCARCVNMRIRSKTCLTSLINGRIIDSLERDSLEARCHRTRRRGRPPWWLAAVQQ